MSWLCPVIWGQLKERDFKIALDAKSKGCPFCGGKLDWASFPRKTRGIDYLHDERRFSFCCRVCRKRVTPESNRFLWKNVYVLLFIALASAGGDLAVRVNRCTLQRWRMFWAEHLSVRSWFAGRIRYRLPIEFNCTLPSLVEKLISPTRPQFLRLANLLTILGCAPRLRFSDFRAEDGS